jgi:hypothetical protein
VGIGGPHAAVARRGLALTPCAPITLRLFNSSGRRAPTRVRVERVGVSCASAHRLILTFLRRATPRNCASRGNLCLLPVGGGWSCMFVTGSVARGVIMECARSRTSAFRVVPVARVTQRDFHVATAPGVNCEMSAATVFCENVKPPRNDTARLAADGALRVCRSTSAGGANGCLTGNPGEGTPRYGAGRSVTLGPFRCTVIAAGVRCVVRASGKGFAMTATDVTALGGATIVPSPT